MIKPEQQQWYGARLTNNFPGNLESILGVHTPPKNLDNISYISKIQPF